LITPHHLLRGTVARDKIASVILENSGRLANLPLSRFAFAARIDKLSFNSLVVKLPKRFSVQELLKDFSRHSLVKPDCSIFELDRHSQAFTVMSYAGDKAGALVSQREYGTQQH
jgi:hypothetical protein